jgi:hypothetical protein
MPSGTKLTTPPPRTRPSINRVVRSTTSRPTQDCSPNPTSSPTRPPSHIVHPHRTFEWYPTLRPPLSTLAFTPQILGQKHRPAHPIPQHHHQPSLWLAPTASTSLLGALFRFVAVGCYQGRRRRACQHSLRRGQRSIEASLGLFGRGRGGEVDGRRTTH